MTNIKVFRKLLNSYAKKRNYYERLYGPLPLHYNFLSRKQSTNDVRAFARKSRTLLSGADDDQYSGGFPTVELSPSQPAGPTGVLELALMIFQFENQADYNLAQTFVCTALGVNKKKMEPGLILVPRGFDSTQANGFHTPDYKLCFFTEKVTRAKMRQQNETTYDIAGNILLDKNGQPIMRKTFVPERTTQTMYKVALNAPSAMESFCSFLGREVGVMSLVGHDYITKRFCASTPDKREAIKRTLLEQYATKALLFQDELKEAAAAELEQQQQMLAQMKAKARRKSKSDEAGSSQVNENSENETSVLVSPKSSMDEESTLSDSRPRSPSGIPEIPQAAKLLSLLESVGLESLLESDFRRLENALEYIFEWVNDRQQILEKDWNARPRELDTAIYTVLREIVFDCQRIEARLFLDDSRATNAEVLEKAIRDQYRYQNQMRTELISQTKAQRRARVFAQQAAFATQSAVETQAQEGVNIPSFLVVAGFKATKKKFQLTFGESDHVRTLRLTPTSSSKNFCFTVAVNRSAANVVLSRALLRPSELKYLMAAQYDLMLDRIARGWLFDSFVKFFQDSEYDIIPTMKNQLRTREKGLMASLRRLSDTTLRVLKKDEYQSQLFSIQETLTKVFCETVIVSMFLNDGLETLNKLAKFVVGVLEIKGEQFSQSQDQIEDYIKAELVKRSQTLMSQYENASRTSTGTNGLRSYLFYMKNFLAKPGTVQTAEAPQGLNYKMVNYSDVIGTLRLVNGVLIRYANFIANDNGGAFKRAWKKVPQASLLSTTPEALAEVYKKMFMLFKQGVDLYKALLARAVQIDTELGTQPTTNKMNSLRNHVSAQQVRDWLDAVLALPFEELYAASKIKNCNPADLQAYGSFVAEFLYKYYTDLLDLPGMHSNSSNNSYELFVVLMTAANSQKKDSFASPMMTALVSYVSENTQAYKQVAIGEDAFLGQPEAQENLKVAILESWHNLNEGWSFVEILADQLKLKPFDQILTGVDLSKVSYDAVWEKPVMSAEQKAKFDVLGSNVDTVIPQVSFDEGNVEVIEPASFVSTDSQEEQNDGPTGSAEAPSAQSAE